MATALQELARTGRDVPFTDLHQPAGLELARALQAHLTRLGLLDPMFDGNETSPFGPIHRYDGRIGVNTRNAIGQFCAFTDTPYLADGVSAPMIELLTTVQPDELFPLRLDPAPGDDDQTRLAKRVLRFMQLKGYWIARAPNMFNIVYVEGIDSEGRRNADVLNEWNDRRLVIRIRPDGQPEMWANDLATTEPGRHYTLKPIKRLGVARIAFGQYKAWVDGIHQGASGRRQPALVQRDRVRIHRDLNRDGRRSPQDPVFVSSTFGINQHSTTPNYEPRHGDGVDDFSAGCLVGCRYRYHLSFLQIVRQDCRYQMNKGYMFITAVLNGDEVTA